MSDIDPRTEADLSSCGVPINPIYHWCFAVNDSFYDAAKVAGTLYAARANVAKTSDMPEQAALIYRHNGEIRVWTMALEITRADIQVFEERLGLREWALVDERGDAVLSSEGRCEVSDQAMPPEFTPFIARAFELGAIRVGIYARDEHFDWKLMADFKTDSASLQLHREWKAARPKRYSHAKYGTAWLYMTHPEKGNGRDE